MENERPYPAQSVSHEILRVIELLLAGWFELGQYDGK